ncbi:MAG TPA: cytochrome c biogenesis protein DipZ [Candidatus Acidoferrales bacterium]|nr:cytochrome c biogenesis protein DipZ [Candidatus Acidoferrales bacterium]
MLLYLLAFVGGILTIVSPCILPVLPFVFSRADQPFRRSGLPLLAGMAFTFALVAAVATVAGAWIVRANQIGRILAMVIFGVLGLALLFPSLAEYLSRPFVRLGGRVRGQDDAKASIGKSLLLGVSTGLLWAPCAGPILGLILTGAAVEGASAHTALLLVAFAAGAGCSLAVALLAGNRVFALMKRFLGAEEWIRRGLGVAVLVGVVAIASGWDTGILRRLSLSSTSGVEQDLIDRFRPVAYARGADSSAQPAAQIQLGNEGSLPSLDGAVAWLNSPPLARESLKGKVVVVDFWTYSCINCLRAIPYVEAWSQKYKNDGLVVIGVHTPEFAFEKDQANVAKAVQDLKITYPVAIDSNYAIWKAFNNQYWPAHYFIDAQGTIRYHHFGEGEYDKSEEVIQELLKERNANLKLSGFVQVAGSGAQAAADVNDIQSPETYVGYERQEGYVSPEKINRDAPGVYTAPGRLDVNHWALAGKWDVGGGRAMLVAAPGKILFRFHARDLHLVLGPGKDGKPVRFRVLLDGAPPAEDHGVDVDAQGNGIVKGYRLYQLIRQKGKVEDRTFQIEFVDPGVQAFAFTFG